jgi:hypothetical protein
MATRELVELWTAARLEIFDRVHAPLIAALFSDLRRTAESD